MATSPRRPARPLGHRRPSDTGQATVEYALVLLAAAAIAVLVITWATTTGRVGALFDRVFDNVVADVPDAP
jgi:hypothetical protein